MKFFTKYFWKITTLFFFVTTLLFLLFIFDKLKLPVPFFIGLKKALTSIGFLSSLIGAGIAGLFSIYVLKQQTNISTKLLSIQLEDSRNLFKTQQIMELNKLKLSNRLEIISKVENSAIELEKIIQSTMQKDINYILASHSYIEKNNSQFTTLEYKNKFNETLPFMESYVQNFLQVYRHLSILTEYTNILSEDYSQIIEKFIKNDCGMNNYIQINEYLSKQVQQERLQKRFLIIDKSIVRNFIEIVPTLVYDLNEIIDKTIPLEKEHQLKIMEELIIQ